MAETTPSNIAGLAYNITKSITLPLVFFTFFKLYKWYQIAQRISFIINPNPASAPVYSEAATRGAL